MSYKRGRRDARLAGANRYLRENGEHFLRPGLIFEAPATAAVPTDELPPKDDWEAWALQSLGRSRDTAPLIGRVSIGNETDTRADIPQTAEQMDA